MYQGIQLQSSESFKIIASHSYALLRIHIEASHNLNKNSLWYTIEFSICIALDILLHV